MSSHFCVTASFSEMPCHDFLAMTYHMPVTYKSNVSPTGWIQLLAVLSSTGSLGMIFVCLPFLSSDYLQSLACGPFSHLQSQQQSCTRACSHFHISLKPIALLTMRRSLFLISVLEIDPYPGDEHTVPILRLITSGKVLKVTDTGDSEEYQWRLQFCLCTHNL